MSNNKPELMRQIADAMEQDPDGWWREFEYPDRSGAYHQHISEPDLFNSLMYHAKIRPRPRTVRIDVEVPEPMREYPNHGESYWSPSTVAESGCLERQWTDGYLDRRIFQRGIWPTEHEAQQAAAAIFGALGRKV